MRRESVYPHRSGCALPVSRPRFYAGVGTALFLGAAVLCFGTFPLTAHRRLSCLILEHTGIPDPSMKSLGVFSHLGPVTAPDVSFAAHRVNPVGTAALFGAFLFGLILIHRKYLLNWNFAVFLIVLCGVGGVILFNTSFNFDSRRGDPS
jgi:hypothetical protein